MSATLRRATVRQSKRERLQEAARANATRQEALDEAIAPAAQRQATTLRGPLVARDGQTFRAWPVIAMLVRGGQKREANGQQATISQEHGKTAMRLMIAHRESETVSHGVSSYGERSRAAVQSGYIAQSVLDGVGRQRDAQAEIIAARRRLGDVWPVVRGVVLDNLTVEAYAAREKLDRMVMAGELRAALTLLCGFYRDLDRARGERDE